MTGFIRKQQNTGFIEKCWFNKDKWHTSKESRLDHICTNVTGFIMGNSETPDPLKSVGFIRESDTRKMVRCRSQFVQIVLVL